MRFQREIATPELIEELKPLFEKHYLEIAHYQDIPLDPDYDQYVKVEGTGCLRVFTAREFIDNAEHLVGYCIFFIRPNLHYKSSLQASQDVLFIHPSFRSLGFGAKFLSFCDDELRKEGAQAVYHHVKEAHNFGPLLKKLGYQLVDLIYARRLD